MNKCQKLEKRHFPFKRLIAIPFADGIPETRNESKEFRIQNLKNLAFGISAMSRDAVALKRLANDMASSSCYFSLGDVREQWHKLGTAQIASHEET